MSNGSGKSFRDTAVQLLATVMIPVSVAGTGLYYTRWQQNLNDLKTMIDLVSNQNPERRKYGVAMFEYLLKNDKVPGRMFVAAQLSYANSSSDRDLLPLMEQALYKASAENSKVEETFRLALERMPSRLTVHAMNDKQRQLLQPAVRQDRRGGAHRHRGAGLCARPMPGGGGEHELRYFLPTDEARAGELQRILGAGCRAGGSQADELQPSGAALGTRGRPNAFELWLGSQPHAGLLRLGGEVPKSPHERAARPLALPVPPSFQPGGAVVQVSVSPHARACPAHSCGRCRLRGCPCRATGHEEGGREAAGLGLQARRDGMDGIGVVRCRHFLLLGVRWLARSAIPAKWRGGAGFRHASCAGVTRASLQVCR